MYNDQIKNMYYEYSPSDESNAGIDPKKKCSHLLLTILPSTIKRKGTTSIHDESTEE